MIGAKIHEINLTVPCRIFNLSARSVFRKELCVTIVHRQVVVLPRCTSFSPLVFLRGNPGAGKTKVMELLSKAFREVYPTLRLINMSDAIRICFDTYMRTVHGIETNTAGSEQEKQAHASRITDFSNLSMGINPLCWLKYALQEGGGEPLIITGLRQPWDLWAASQIGANLVLIEADPDLCHRRIGEAALTRSCDSMERILDPFRDYHYRIVNNFEGEHALEQLAEVVETVASAIIDRPVAPPVTIPPELIWTPPPHLTIQVGVPSS